MREFELIVDEAFKNGLSPELTIPFNTQVLLECLGFRCGKFGLEPYVEGENPLPSALDMYYSWPYPQFMSGEGYNFLIVRDSLINHEDVVYVIADDMTTITYMFSIDELTFGVGTLMEVADFGEYAFMTNGVIMIYWDTTISDWHEITSSATIPMMRTICNFKGQAVGGNIVSSWHDCDETFYVWSKTGEMDFTPDRQNEAGYRRCPYGGEVYHVRRLGDIVVGYSSKGITLMTPVASPVATFGFREVSDVGLHNRGAMNGNLDRQIYVGEDLIIREVTSKGINELGYQQYMEQLAGEDIIVNYDKSKGDFYIGNSFKTYLLSTNGLTEIPQHPSAVWRVDSDNVYMLPDATDDYYPLITIEPFDMGYKGQKTIATIESDAFSVANPYVAVDYALDLESWNSTPFVPSNNMGIATITAAGNMFRFKLRFDNIGSGFKIGYTKVRYKMTDLRGIRGVYAPPPRGQR